MKKAVKKFFAVLVALTMVLSVIPTGFIGTAFAAGETPQSNDDSTISLPLKIRDTYIDGFIFEFNKLDPSNNYKNLEITAFGETSSVWDTQKVTTGLVESQLVNGKPVYRYNITNNSNSPVGVDGLAKNIKYILEQDSDYIDNYYKTSGNIQRKKYLYNALRAKIPHTNRYVYTEGTAADKPTSFDQINSCYGAAYWMTYSLFRDDVTFKYNNQTYSYTKNVTEYDHLILNKLSDGSYEFAATTANENVKFDTTNKFIQNAGNSNRGGFFAVDGIGLNDKATGSTNVEHNFGFTLESSGKLVYRQAENLYFDFAGDDDVYLFINNKLALDIGGQHGQVNKSVYLEQACPYDRSKTWAQYLGLEEGKSYDFNFFYMERHTTASNMKIKTNIRVYDPSAVPEKNAYLDNEKIPYGGFVPKSSKINYEFVLNNTGDLGITDLTFEDDILGVQLSKNNIVLNGETDISNISVKILNGDTVTLDESNITADRLKEILRNGISPGQSIRIKGFNYTLPTGIDQVLNTVKYTAVAGEKTLTNTAQNLVIPVASGEKVYVVDYAKPVVYSDAFNEAISSVATGGTTITNHSISIVNGNGSYGTMELNSTNKTIKYTLNKIMNGSDTFKFNHVIAYRTKKGETGTVKLQTTVKMIPATTVYYEDTFVSENPSTGIVYSGASWQVTTNGVGYEELQAGDNPYGYDNSYGNDSQDGNGSIHIATGTYDATTTAKFNFKGRGVDIIGRTSYDSGAIRVDVYSINDSGELSAEPVKSKIVVNEYRDGDNNSTLYQIPVMKMRNLPYGSYQVVITVAASNIFTSNSIFYLDGIRIYDPLYDSQEANEQYVKDNEGYPEYMELRDKLIAEKDLNADGTTNENAVLFVDSNGIANLDEFKNVGPTNEIYLAKNQSVGFILDVDMTNVASIQLGAKAIAGNAKVEVGINPTGNSSNKQITLNSATDMYYDITNYIGTVDGSKILFIKSIGENPASLTQLKITYKTNPIAPARAMVNSTMLKAVRMVYTAAPIVEPEEPTVDPTEPAVPEEPTVDPTEPVVPEEPQVPELNLTINNVKFNKKEVKAKRDLKITVKVSKDVKSLIVLDKYGKIVTINKIEVDEDDDENEFEITIKAPSTKDRNYYYQIIGVNGELQTEPFITGRIAIK